MFQNYLLIVMVTAWASAQILKTFINFFEYKTFNPERLVGAGGMPSAHSAFVCSLTVAAAKQLGVSSPEFAISLALATIVMYDAMGVRRAAGEQAKVINKIVKGFRENPSDFWRELGISIEKEEETQIDSTFDNIEEYNEELYKEKKLKEYIGHTPMEVLGGALLGILVATIIPLP